MKRVGTERAPPRFLAVARSTPGVLPTEFLNPNLEKPSYLPAAPGPIDRQGPIPPGSGAAPSTRLMDRDKRPALIYVRKSHTLFMALDTGRRNPDALDPGHLSTRQSPAREHRWCRKGFTARNAAAALGTFLIHTGP